MDDGCPLESDEDSLRKTSSSDEEFLPSKPVQPTVTFPEFDATSWNPQQSSGLDYLSLVPIGSFYNPEYKQEDHISKLKISQAQRKKRLKTFQTKKTSGRHVVDEKRLRNAANNNDIKTGERYRPIGPLVYVSVQELLDDGVDPCCYDDKRRSPLHFAASQGHESVVKALLDKGADPNQNDILGNTPLHLAACTGHVPVVTLLLKAGTDLMAVDRSGRTPLFVAKSRLKLLVNEKSYSSQRVKEEALQVTEMMRTYLNMSGMSDEIENLRILCGQLQTVTSREEVDQVNVLLSELASLSLEKKKKPP